MGYSFMITLFFDKYFITKIIFCYYKNNILLLLFNLDIQKNNCEVTCELKNCPILAETPMLSHTRNIILRGLSTMSAR